MCQLMCFAGLEFFFALEELMGQSGSFQKLKAGPLESFRETQCLHFSKWIKWNANILSVCFFHSSQHLGLGPYHPMLFLLVLRFFLPFLLCVMTTGVSSLKKFFRNISEL